MPNTTDTAREAFERVWTQRPPLAQSVIFDDGKALAEYIWQASRATLPKVTEAEINDLIESASSEWHANHNGLTWRQHLARAILAKFPFLGRE